MNENFSGRWPVTSLAPALALTLLLPGAAMAADEAASSITGHLDIVSKYVARGGTSVYGNASAYGNAGADAPESNRPALQWGLDWAHPSGWSLGYFGSTINYSYKQLGRLYDDPSIMDFQRSKSIENDFYGAYSGVWGDLGYTAGLTGYYYINGRYTTALETKLGLSYGPFSATAQTLLNDVVWGNKGDTYYTLIYTKTLPYDLTFTGTLGAYTYKQTGKYLGTACAPDAYLAIFCSVGSAPVGSAFRHATLALSMRVPDTNVSLGIQAIFGGKNRFGISQKNLVVASASYSF